MTPPATCPSIDRLQLALAQVIAAAEQVRVENIGLRHALRVAQADADTSGPPCPAEHAFGACVRRAGHSGAHLAPGGSWVDVLRGGP